MAMSPYVARRPTHFSKQPAVRVRTWRTAGLPTKAMAPAATRSFCRPVEALLGREPINARPDFLKEAIIKAAVAGGEEGLTGYLQAQANANPSAFMALLGKVLPLQMAGVDGVRQLVEVKLTVVQSEQQTSKPRVLDAKPLAQP